LISVSRSSQRLAIARRLALADASFEVTRNTLLLNVSGLELTHYSSGSAAPGATLDPSGETFPSCNAAKNFPDLSRPTERHFPSNDGSVDDWARGFVTAYL